MSRVHQTCGEDAGRLDSIVPRTGDAQFFLDDPDGVGVELNFRGLDFADQQESDSAGAQKVFVPPPVRHQYGRDGSSEPR